MRLTVTAWRLRKVARQALDAGQLARALTLASDAQHVHWTPAGAAFRVLLEWLTGIERRELGIPNS